jgi:hypothetical protein
VGVTKEREMREALKAAISEIRRSCDTAVDAVTPLYSLTSEADFMTKFGTLHAAFKNAYLKDVTKVRTHCFIVEAQMKRLLNYEQWKKNVPLLQRSYKRLEQLCRDWLFSDFSLAAQMESLLRNIDAFYTEIDTLGRQDEKAAFAALRSGTVQFEDEFLSLRKQLNALDVLGSTL